jgi:rRNA large subunit m3Psi methyltransferase RlmH
MHLVVQYFSNRFPIFDGESVEVFSDVKFNCVGIERWSEGGRLVVFLIGGSWGLTDEVRKKAHHLLSFGKQTMPHVLTRILLLEQLYRAETILRGKEYHK